MKVIHCDVGNDVLACVVKVVGQSADVGVVQVVGHVVCVADELQIGQLHNVAGVGDVLYGMDLFRTVDVGNLEAEIFVGRGVVGEPVVGDFLIICRQLRVVGYAGEHNPRVMIVLPTLQRPRLRAAVRIAFRIGGGAQAVALRHDKIVGEELDEFLGESVVLVRLPVSVDFAIENVVHQVWVEVVPLYDTAAGGGVEVLGVEEIVALSVVGDLTLGCSRLPRHQCCYRQHQYEDLV